MELTFMSRDIKFKVQPPAVITSAVPIPLFEQSYNVMRQFSEVPACMDLNWKLQYRKIEWADRPLWGSMSEDTSSTLLAPGVDLEQQNSNAAKGRKWASSIMRERNY